MSGQPRLTRLALILYVSTLSIDAMRKVAGLPTKALGIIYVITALIYLTTSPRVAGQSRGFRRTLPLWLILLSIWCLTVAFSQGIQHEMALLGWASYVFFVPLAYFGAALTVDDKTAAKVLRFVTICGGAIGVSTIAGAILGSSAPALLQPIIPSVGFHSFSSTNNIYLSPSVFATAEETSEQLLIAFFACIALTHLNNERPRWRQSAILGGLIIGGLLFAARRADIYVAAAGTVAVLLFDCFRAPTPGEDAPRSRRFGLVAGGVIAWSVGSAILLADSTLRSFLVSGSTGDRVSLMFWLTNSGSPLGQGPGTSTQGITVLGSPQLASAVASTATRTYILNGRIFTTVEGGLAKTWLELGIIGVLLYGAVFLSALAPAIHSVRRLDGVGASLTALAFALCVIFLKNHQSLDDPLIQPLFWLAVGGIWGRLRAHTDLTGLVHPEHRAGDTGLEAPSPPGRRNAARDLLLQRTTFDDSAPFSEGRYAEGGTSGNG